MIQLFIDFYEESVSSQMKFSRKMIGVSEFALVLLDFNHTEYCSLLERKAPSISES